MLYFDYIIPVYFLHFRLMVLILVECILMQHQRWDRCIQECKEWPGKIVLMNYAPTKWIFGVAPSCPNFNHL